jgi:hypothetical protein
MAWWWRYQDSKLQSGRTGVQDVRYTLGNIRAVISGVHPISMYLRVYISRACMLWTCIPCCISRVYPIVGVHLMGIPYLMGVDLSGRNCYPTPAYHYVEWHMVVCYGGLKWFRCFEASSRHCRTYHTCYVNQLTRSCRSFVLTIAPKSVNR